MWYLFRGSFGFSFIFKFTFTGIVDSLRGWLQLIKAQRTYRLLTAQVRYIVVKMSKLGVKIQVVS